MLHDQVTVDSNKVQDSRGETALKLTIKALADGHVDQNLVTSYFGIISDLLAMGATWEDADAVGG